ncbi:transcription termination factor MTERF15, mitochondrial isoform X3 [Eutrema salsugineum]|uniref:transcription termination factor MTERF15, mitochondrial isoform X3 n=1 Tax=Eutrema salsugineum TaxID=72664 RepID=UPI000CED0318|nr:transcription termination factor MTERF15, mitochondrial isoform X3 [Eutrema salsugineum]
MYSLIFHGKKSIELQKWRNPRILVMLFQNVFAFSNSFSTAIAAAASPDVSPRDGQKGNNFTVSYLVESLGLTTKLAESISRKVSIEDSENPDAERSIGPKLQSLQSRGASTSELTEIVSKVPKILGIKKDKAFNVYYDFIKEVIEADKSSKFKKLSHSLPQGSKQENKLRNVLALRELGVPQRLLLPLLISGPKFACGKERFEESLKKVVEMGFDPTSLKFVEALRIVQGLKEETIKEKVNVYKSLGFAVEDVWTMFKKWPNSLTYSEKKITKKFETLKKCGLVENEILSVFKKSPHCIGVSEQRIENFIDTLLGLGFSRDEFVIMVNRFPQGLNLSAENVKKKTEFLVKKMNWPLKAVASTPAILGYSMEKRIVPRCNVIKALMSKGLIGSELPALSPVLAITDQAFLNKYVKKHDDKELVADLMAIFMRKTRKKDKAFGPVRGFEVCKVLA